MRSAKDEEACEATPHSTFYIPHLVQGGRFELPATRVRNEYATAALPLYDVWNGSGARIRTSLRRFKAGDPTARRPRNGE